MANKNSLKVFFETNKKPTEDQFAELIESSLNWEDDIATTAEVQAAANNKFLTPAGAQAAVLHFTPVTPNASETVRGIVELATLAEAQAGTDTSRAVTPSGAKKAAQTFAPVQTVNGNAPVSGNVTIATVTDTNWTDVLAGAFSNGTSSLDAANSVRYRKINNVVYLDGKIKGGTSQTAGVSYLLFTLPINFRPSRKSSFVVYKADTATTFSIGRIDIASDGTVYGVLYSSVHTNLAGIAFPVVI
ncbi:MAG TPA: hypothetical protein VF676_02200 [Flavobacterium sp.]|jgi:hypothetical protein